MGRTQRGAYFRVRPVFIGPLICPVMDLTDARLITIALFHSLEWVSLVSVVRSFCLLLL